jgi:hypothetical protein
MPDVGGLTGYLDLAGPAAGVLIVGFTEGLAAAKTYAARAGYRIAPNRELVGLGAANLGAWLCSGMVVNGSLSKTAVNGAAGARSQLSGLVVAADDRSSQPVNGPRRRPRRPHLGHPISEYEKTLKASDVNSRRRCDIADAGKLPDRRAEHAGRPPADRGTQPDGTTGQTTPHGPRIRAWSSKRLRRHPRWGVWIGCCWMPSSPGRGAVEGRCAVTR